VATVYWENNNLKSVEGAVIMRKSRQAIVITVFCLTCAFLQVEAESAELKAGKILRDCPQCPEMVVIPAGSFDMGSNSGETNEKPRHRVTISYAFAMGKTEVTQGQWRALMGDNPSYFKKCGDSCPVEQVSWDEAHQFIEKLNSKTGKNYRLPSEAEWEYACRAGGTHEYCGSNAVDSVAWYGANANPAGNSQKTSNMVRLKKANAFGLYDMSGNVWEWVEDNYHANYDGAPNDGSAWYGSDKARILRGGAWDDESEFSRAGVRYTKMAVFKTNYDGFRLVRQLP